MSKLKTALMAISGTVITGAGIGMFLTPNKIVGGGASGLSTILFHTLSIPAGISYFIINLLFLLIGFKVLGKQFTTKTLFSVAILSAFVELFSLIPIQVDNLILASIFGGVMYGIGIGLNFAAGASTGGTDILGRIVQTKFPHIPIGKMLMFIDGIVILASFLVFKNIELTLYGILSLFVVSTSIDLVISKLNISRIAFVITDKGEEIADKLIQTSPRGVTIIKGTGAYSHTQKDVLFCALKESEAEAFQKKILEIDTGSFIVFSESQRIKGNGFSLYK